MMFMIDGAVFFHATALEDFIDNIHGKTNDLLKAVSLNIKEDLQSRNQGPRTNFKVPHHSIMAFDRSTRSHT